MPFVLLSVLSLAGADSDRPQVLVVETPTGAPIPVASASRRDLAASAATAVPTVKRDHERRLQTLHVQKALSEARKALERDDAAFAIQVLEEQLDGAGGADDYLDLLDAAYRRHLAFLVKNDRMEEANLVVERRKILASRTPTEATPVSVPAKEPEAPIPEAAPKPATKSGGLGAGLIGQLFGKRAPSKRETAEKKVVRARWDHDDASTDEIEPKPQPIPAVGDSTKTNPVVDDLAQAEKLWKEREFLQALAHYEKAYQTNPDGAVQQARDRFGYCLLWAAYSKYEPKTADADVQVDDRSFAAWEADVMQGRRLCRIESFRKFADDQLSLLEERRQARRYRAAAPTPKSTAAVNPAVAPTAVVAPAASKSTANVPYRHLDHQHKGGWRVTETENFRIVHRDVALAEEVAVIAENARRQAHEMWFAAEPLAKWTPKCDLVLYPTAQEFAQQTKQMPASPAFAQCDVHNGVVASRRIELRTDEANMKSGILPHEIAHAVFAGQFAGRSPPKWADEGMAVLTEPDEIQQRHLAGLVQARSQQRGFRCDQLLPMQGYPAQVQEFYAHSVGVCRLLVEQHGGRDRLVQFVRSAVETNNYDDALFRIYNIRGMKDLETRFQQYVAEIRSSGYAAR